MYYLFRIAVIIVPWLPDRFIQAIGYSAGLVAWLVATKAREQATENMVHVLGSHTLKTRAGRRRLRRIVQTMFRYNVLNYLTVFALPAKKPAEILGNMQVEGAEHLEAALARGKGVVIFAPHIGPFDYIIQWMGLSGYDMAVPVEYLKDQRMLNLMTGLRGSHGVHFLPLIGSTPMRTMLQKLRSNNVVLIASDRAIQGSSQVMPFFGAAAPLPTGAVQLAQRTGATLVGAFSWRIPGGKVCGYFRPLTLALPEEQRTHTESMQQAIIALMEQEIAAHPANWVAFQPIWTEKPAVAHLMQDP